jgi:hypothetical protein
MGGTLGSDRTSGENIALRLSVANLVAGKQIGLVDRVVIHPTFSIYKDKQTGE